MSLCPSSGSGRLATSPVLEDQSVLSYRHMFGVEVKQVDHVLLTSPLAAHPNQSKFASSTTGTWPDMVCCFCIEGVSSAVTFETFKT